MRKIRLKNISVIFILPFLMAALMCCCITGKAQAQAQDASYRPIKTVHDCCDKTQNNQHRSGQQHQKECQCNISALEVAEVNVHGIVYQHEGFLNTTFQDENIYADRNVVFSGDSRFKVLENSPPIYIRVAHLLI